MAAGLRSKGSICTEMASQIAVTGEPDVVEFKSYMRGYHAYMDCWTPVAGQSLLLKREPTNSHNKHAVAVYLEDEVVGHVSYNLAPKMSAFLRRDVNKGFAEVTGDRVNRGAGYGLEVPCTYHLYGPRTYVDKMKEFIDSLHSAGHL